MTNSKKREKYKRVHRHPLARSRSRSRSKIILEGLIRKVYGYTKLMIFE